ncbi:MAG: hypothetical protein K9L65_05965 [Chromatiaceae bacterium]|nr:hypothetical protein [Chromatiaceae bacterium]
MLKFHALFGFGAYSVPDQYRALCLANRLTAELAQAEARIDSLVYRLFELTDEEIALLEAAIDTH